MKSSVKISYLKLMFDSEQSHLHASIVSFSSLASFGSTSKSVAWIAFVGRGAHAAAATNAASFKARYRKRWCNEGQSWLSDVLLGQVSDKPLHGTFS